MKLVEVIRTKQTSDATYNALFEVTKKMGKVPVACKDTPGYDGRNQQLTPASSSTVSSSPTCVSYSKGTTDTQSRPPVWSSAVTPPPRTLTPP